MHVGSVTSSDLSGLITGIGFYTVDNGGVQASVRYDQLSILGVVPEPGVTALLLLASSLLLVRSRKRSILG